MKTDVGELEKILQKELDSLGEVNTWRKEQENALNEDEEKIQKRLRDMDKVTTGKDYFDLQKELEYHKKRAKEHETEVLKLMGVVEEREKIVTSRQEQIKSFWEMVHKREAEIEASLKTVEEEYALLVGQRQELFSGIDKALIRKYDFLAARRFPPLVPALEERCTGCSMGIPPQKFNSLYDAKEIVECPFCARILYIEEE
ncbi:hypothetical protein KKF84_05635 [Myxococcota bacterium]|nr:hypothetical protein [Myxococcota bacterium]MBU1534780.1 hypothetical protein [Myxococcota bacterium]